MPSPAYPCTRFGLGAVTINRWIRASYSSRTPAPNCNSRAPPPDLRPPASGALPDRSAGAYLLRHGRCVTPPGNSRTHPTSVDMNGNPAPMASRTTRGWASQCGSAEKHRSAAYPFVCCGPTLPGTALLTRPRACSQPGRPARSRIPHENQDRVAGSALPGRLERQPLVLQSGSWPGTPVADAKAASGSPAAPVPSIEPRWESPR